jgi:hypothetical protein
VPNVVQGREFHEAKLWLVDGGRRPVRWPDVRVRRRDEPARVPLAHARASGATGVGLQVDDIERVVDELTAKRAAFERTTKRPDHGQARHRRARRRRSRVVRGSRGNLVTLVQR